MLDAEEEEERLALARARQNQKSEQQRQWESMAIVPACLFESFITLPGCSLQRYLEGHALKLITVENSHYKSTYKC